MLCINFLDVQSFINLCSALLSWVVVNPIDPQSNSLYFLYICLIQLAYICVIIIIFATKNLVRTSVHALMILCYEKFLLISPFSVWMMERCQNLFMPCLLCFFISSINLNSAWHSYTLSTKYKGNLKTIKGVSLHYKQCSSYLLVLTFFIKCAGWCISLLSFLWLLITCDTCSSLAYISSLVSFSLFCQER